MKSRDYEVSLWTIEDEYITTLKHSGAEDKGHLLKPIMQLKTDGTQEFSFSIPLYIYENGQRIENPIWYHTRNGNILINMRKIKVCFHKTDSWQDYRWFEFLITEVKESHKGLQLTCDIKCEGLAFHELGRIGYRISLSPEDFYDDDLKWFKGELENQPHATLQYWMDKVLPVEDLSFTRWTYNVQMDWSAYEKGTGRKSNKVYEESYIKSYQPSQEIEAFQEKERLIDISESNIYNITQKIAETFGVFCRYDYEHDNNGHIMSRTVVFYNNFMKEKEGYLDFTYPYQTADLTRTINSKDLITKMYVRPVDDSTSPSGLITILDVGANQSKEDYIFNFDYLEKIGSFTDWHKSLLQTHQSNLRQINTTISQLANQILIYAEQLPKLKAEVTLHTTALALDKERVATAQDLLNALDVKDGTVDNKISITAQNPRSAILLEDHSSGAATGSYYIKLSDQGIDPSTVKIYKTLDLTQTEVEKRLSNPITTGLAVFDEFNNLEKITNLFKNDGDSSRIFLTYDYTPKLYYDSVVATWERRMEDDENSLNKAQEKYDAINASLEDAQQQYITTLEAKDTLIRNFELALRGLIREGYWQPEDYKDYGDKYQSAWDINITDGTIQVDSGLTSKYATLLFNGQVLLDDEKDKLGYALGVDQQAISYPWIDLSGIIATENFQKNLEKIVFVCPERIASEQTSDTPVPPSTAQSQSDNFGLVGYRVFSVGSTCEYGLVKKDGEIKPALILTGVKTTDIKDNYLQAGEVGLLTTTSTPNQGLKFTKLSDVVNKIHRDRDGTYQFLRIKIDSLELKTSSDELAILLNGTTLKEFEDFYITGTADCKYITLKPKTIFKLYHNAENNSYKANHKIKIRYTLSNASTAIYLDAIEVLKENAYPKVSYTINPSIIDERFYLTAYDNLSRIININDPELKFRDVQGYISGLTLDLDAWWQDKIEVKNYKSKFEDLFSTIVASTEAMQKSEYTRGLTAGLFAGTGGDYLSSDIVKTTLRKVDLNYAFNHGTLTIDPENGIWGVSDSGVVAFRGGGIFTATEKDANGGWIWNTGIVPQGINADLIVTGQLDTNKIKVYAGDRVRFQLNSEGLFGYKSFFEDFNALNTEQQGNVISSLAGFLNDSDDKSKTKELLSDDLDPAQYTVFNENGLFLMAKKGAYVLNRDKTAYLKIGQYQQSMDTTNIESGTTPAALSAKIQAFYADKIDFSQQTGEILNFPEEGVKRVSISWDGLTLRNYNNEKVFFADPDTGDLLLRGNVFAEAFYVLSEVPSTSPQGATTYTRYPLQQYLTVQFEDHVKVSEELGKIFEKAGEIIKTTLTSLTALETITDENYGILKEFAAKAVDLQADVFTDNNPPANFKPGDIWIPISAQSNYYNNKYIAMAYSSQVASQIATNPLAGWNKTYDGSLASITGAKMDVDAAAGTMTLKAKSYLELASGDIQITGSKSINIGSKWVNIGSANGGINIISTNIDENSTTDEDGKISNSISKVQIDRNGIIMHSNKIELLAANNNNNVVAISLDPNKGLWIGSNKEIRFFSGAISNNNSSSANVLLNPDKILFGVNSTGSATVAEFTKQYIIFGAAGSSDGKTDNITDLRKEGIPFTGPNSTVTGLKITPNSIDLATTSGKTDRAVVSITPLGIQIGTATDTNEGSFVNITQSRLVIGSTANMYINTNNIGLDTTKGVNSEASDDNEDTGFRLGLSDAPSLLFARGNLSVTGAIHATSLFINDGNEETAIHGYLPKTFYQRTMPNSGYKEKDLWFNTDNFNTYIANKDYATGATPANDWDKINKKIEGTKLVVDAEAGQINMQSQDIDIFSTGGSLVLRQGESSSSNQGIVMNGDGITVMSGASINISGASGINLTSSTSKMVIAPKNIIIGTMSNGTFAQGITLEKDKLILTAGKVSLTGTTGFIQFQKENASLPNFRVDEDGNVYCKSIVAEEGGTIGKETTTPSTSAQKITSTTESFSLPTGYESMYANTVTFSASGFESNKTYTAIVTVTASGTSGYLQHFNFKIGGVSQGDRSFPIWASKGPVTLNYTFTATSSSISGGIFMQLEQGSLSGTVVIDFYSNFNSGSSTNSTVTGGWSQGTSSNSSSYTVTDKNSGYNLNTVTVTGSWDTNTKEFKVTGTSNNTTSQLLETYVSGAWNTSGTLPVYTIYPENNNSLNLLTTTLDWGSASTYNNYPSNTYLADGVKSLTTIYGYQNGSTYYVKNSQGTTLFTDSVSATEQYEYRIANFSYVTSDTNVSSATSRNKLTTSVQPLAQLQRRLAGTTNAYSLVNTTYGETTDIAIDRQKIKDIYKFLFTAKKIILTRAGTNAIFSVVIDEDGIENTYEYDLEFTASDIGYQNAITRTFA